MARESFRLSDALQEQAEEISDALGIDKSEVFRRGVKSFAADHDPEKRIEELRNKRDYWEAELQRVQDALDEVNDELEDARKARNARENVRDLEREERKKKIQETTASLVKLWERDGYHSMVDALVHRKPCREGWLSKYEMLEKVKAEYEAKHGRDTTER
jgi:uncharacterized coiled-coil DUF342 family protein